MSQAVLVNVIVVGALLATFGLLPVVLRWFRDRPTGRLSARDRLIARNPTLNVDASFEWSIAARRVHFGWITTLAVAVAVLVVADRPVPVNGDGGS